jgi:membrane protease YdiL (CAAX protease family)
MSNASTNVASALQPRPKAPKKGRWLAPVSLLIVAVVYIAGEIIGSLAISIYPRLQRWSAAQANNWLNNAITAQFFFVLIVEALTLAGILGAMKLLGWTPNMVGLSRFKWWHIALGLFVLIPYYIVFIISAAIISHFVPSFNVAQHQDLGFNNVIGVPNLMLTFCSLVLLPPFVEELTFRGFLYTGMRKWFPKIISALIVSGVFGAAHLAEGGASGPLWVGALDTFTLSLFLVSLREYTGSLWSGITLHALKNGVAFFTLYGAYITSHFITHMK